MLIFPFSDHLEDSLSSEVEFSKNVDPAARFPEWRVSRLSLEMWVEGFITIGVYIQCRASVSQSR